MRNEANRGEEGAITQEVGGADRGSRKRSVCPRILSVCPRILSQHAVDFSMRRLHAVVRYRSNYHK